MFGWSGVAVQFVLLATVWGASFLFIKIGLTGLSPGQVVWARLVFGALALAVIVLVRRRPLPRDARLWAHLGVVAVLLCVVPFLLFSWAEQRIPSSLASILNSTTPLLTMLISSVALRAERLTPPRTIGLALGFAGVLTIVGVWHGVGGAGSPLVAELACLGATTCYGLAFVYLRRFVAPHGGPAVEPATLAFGQVLVGAVLMLALTPALGGSPVHAGVSVVLSMVALGALGTGVAYLWNINIIAAWGAANAAAVTYLTPVVGGAARRPRPRRTGQLEPAGRRGPGDPRHPGRARPDPAADGQPRTAAEVSRALASGVRRSGGLGGSWPGDRRGGHPVMDARPAEVTLPVRGTGRCWSPCRSPGPSPGSCR